MTTAALLLMRLTYVHVPFMPLQRLPVNDTWLMAGCEWAAAARDVLDYLALNGGVTAPAIAQLNRLVEVGGWPR